MNRLVINELSCFTFMFNPAVSRVDIKKYDQHTGNFEHYFYREFSEPTQLCNIQLHEGEYKFSVPFEVVAQIDTYDINEPEIPEFEKLQDLPVVQIAERSDLDGQIAIYDRQDHIIFLSPNFQFLPEYQQVFILAHEGAHAVYSSEPPCDLVATYVLIKAGYNPSLAIYCLEDLLHDKDHSENVNRVEAVYEYLQLNGLAE